MTSQEKYEKVMKLKKENPEKPIADLCKDLKLAPGNFYQLRKKAGLGNPRKVKKKGGKKTRPYKKSPFKAQKQEMMTIPYQDEIPVVTTKNSDKVALIIGDITTIANILKGF